MYFIMRSRKRKKNGTARPSFPPPALIERLEDRQLLSATVHHAAKIHTAVHHVKHQKVTATSTSATSGTTTTATDTTTTTDDGDFGGGEFNGGATIQFSQAPSAVQTGLTTLASTDNLAAPTATQTLYLGNANGVESYTLNYSSTGAVTRITVDQNGNPVTAPTTSTTTFGTLSGTGTGGNSAAASEITAIATALGLTAPTSTTTVNVTTRSSGNAVYTVRLASSTSTSDLFEPGRVISVDSGGNPVGNENLPFSVLPSGIQSAINKNAPTGATALDASSTQTVNVRTLVGVTTYSTTFTSSGATTTVTVTAAGVPTSLPSVTSTTFSAIPSAAQTELQTLANADGYTGTISTSQSVSAYDEGNGTTIYTIHLAVTPTSTSTSTAVDSITITLSSDQSGNPTAPPGRGRRGCGGAGLFGGGGGLFAGGGFDDRDLANLFSSTPISTTTTATGTTSAF